MDDNVWARPVLWCDNGNFVRRREMQEDEFSSVADVEAVKKVIWAETRAFYNKDFEALSRCWVHAPYIRRLGWWTRGGVTDHWGWETIGGRMRRGMLTSPEPNSTAKEVRHENEVVRVSGNMAWATFDQYAPDTGDPDFDMPGLCREARVLEKHDGEWRIVYHTYVHHTAEPVRSPMIRVDGLANISWMNNAAESALKMSEGLIVRLGRLRAVHSGDDQKLQAAIVAAAGRDQTLDGARAAIPLVLESGSSDEVCVCWVMTEGSGSGAVVVSINNHMLAQDYVDASARAFGLSDSQQRVAELIVAGDDLVRSADRLGISINTARTHLQRIFEKTGVRSQAALVRILLSSARPA
jgi:DNA-binding CsgD family transcriptional regulator